MLVLRISDAGLPDSYRLQPRQDPFGHCLKESQTPGHSAWARPHGTLVATGSPWKLGPCRSYVGLVLWNDTL